MFKKAGFVAALPLVLGGSALLATDASADPPASGDSKAEMIQAVRAAEQLLARGADATTFVHKLYSDDVVMVGGSEGAKHGTAAAIKEVQAWFDYMGPNGIKTCKYTIEDPVLASTTTVSSFLMLSCKANPPTLTKDVYYTEMYIWKKTSKGWQVALEMWAEGKF
jgi:ketosteroid isomerase-like protein